MNWLTLLSLFAKPLGQAVNNGISAASGAAILWATQKGIDANLATAVVGSIALAASTTISALAATQGVQIPIINKDQTNGVTVVPAREAQSAGIRPVDAPLDIVPKVG